MECAVIGCKLKQNANEGCNSCASHAGLVLSFIACFILLVIAALVLLCLMLLLDNKRPASAFSDCSLLEDLLRFDNDGHKP